MIKDNMQTLRFKNSNQYNNMWQSLVNVIPEIKISIKSFYDKLDENKFGPVIYKKNGKPIYHLYIKNRLAIIINVKNINQDKFLEITINDLHKINFNYNGQTPIIIDNIDYFNNFMTDWYDQLLKAPGEIYTYKTYHRKGRLYSIEEVLDKVFLDRTKKDDDEIDFDGDLIHMASNRYKTFKLKGTKCVSCGLEAQYFAKERGNGSDIIRWHFNLYGVDEDGTERLYTKDHILPVSKGGKDHIDNFQTMCSKCNSEKGNGDPTGW